MKTEGVMPEKEGWVWDESYLWTEVEKYEQGRETPKVELVLVYCTTAKDFEGCGEGF